VDKRRYHIHSVDPPTSVKKEESLF
jgi:hypothetical protein